MLNIPTTIQSRQILVDDDYFYAVARVCVAYLRCGEFVAMLDFDGREDF